MRAIGKGAGVRVLRDGGGGSRFMVAPCQSANERTLLLFIEITLAIDGGAAITPFVTAYRLILRRVHLMYLYLHSVSNYYHEFISSQSPSIPLTRIIILITQMLLITHLKM